MRRHAEATSRDTVNIHATSPSVPPSYGPTSEGHAMSLEEVHSVEGASCRVSIDFLNKGHPRLKRETFEASHQPPPVSQIAQFCVQPSSDSPDHPCSAASFEVNSEPHARARPSVRLCVGLKRGMSPCTYLQGANKKSHRTATGASITTPPSNFETVRIYLTSRLPCRLVFLRNAKAKRVVRNDNRLN
jgi:hypothetical protein